MAGVVSEAFVYETESAAPNRTARLLHIAPFTEQPYGILAAAPNQRLEGGLRHGRIDVLTYALTSDSGEGPDSPDPEWRAFL